MNILNSAKTVRKVSAPTGAMSRGDDSPVPMEPQGEKPWEEMTHAERVAANDAKRVRQRAASDARHELETQKKIDELTLGIRHPHLVRDFERAGNYPLSPDLIRYVREQTGRKLSKETEAKALAIVQTWEATAATFKQFLSTPENLKGEVNSQKEEFKDSVLAGEMPEYLPDSRKDLREVFKEARRTHKEKMRKDGGPIINLVWEIGRADIEMFADFGKKLEQDERSAHAKFDSKFGWPFVPSNLLRAVKQAVWRYHNDLPKQYFWHMNPRALCARFAINLEG